MKSLAGTLTSPGTVSANAVELLKEALLNPPVLQLANTSQPFQVHTDASDLAIGAVLLQEDEQGQHPVAYASRKLTAAERNYTITERETLAVVYALSTWKLYLYKHFDVFTDNQAVVYLWSKPHLSKREARWAEFLAEFHFTIHHVAGRMNPADPLTRRSKSELWAELGCLEFSLVGVLLRFASRGSTAYRKWPCRLSRNATNATHH